MGTLGASLAPNAPPGSQFLRGASVPEPSRHPKIPTGRSVPTPRSAFDNPGRFRYFSGRFRQFSGRFRQFLVDFDNIHQDFDNPPQDFDNPPQDFDNHPQAFGNAPLGVLGPTGPRDGPFIGNLVGSWNSLGLSGGNLDP